MQKAFIAAEDKRFYQHKGIDERGLIRAFIGNLAHSGRPQGGSTITQQVVKNLLVGDDLTYERKIREMIVASRVEQALSKAEILELYLNSIYLGRSSWGIEMAARSYFGKSAKELTLAEGALLAGLTKGPNYFNPDRHPERARERLAYVLSRLQEDGAITPRAERRARLSRAAGARAPTNGRAATSASISSIRSPARPRSLAGIEAITANSYTVRSTINPQLQRAVEEALQEGLWRYERSTGRVPVPCRGGQPRPSRPGGSRPTRKPATSGRPGSRRCANARLPLYDVHWTPAVVVEKPAGKKGEAWRVGLPDGRILPLVGRQRDRAAQAHALRRGPGARDRGQGQDRRPRRAAHAADGAGHGGRPGEQDRPHPRHDRRLLLSAEPAQSRDPGASASPARPSSR